MLSEKALEKIIVKALWPELIWLDTPDEQEALIDERTQSVQRILKAIEDEGKVIVQREPTEELLMSMAVRYDNALGVPGYYDQPIFKQFEGKNHIPHSRRVETALSQMRQIHEEVVGKGFYSPENADRYRAMISAHDTDGRTG